jgi:hypothetical protein
MHRWSRRRGIDDDVRLRAGWHRHAVDLPSRTSQPRPGVDSGAYDGPTPGLAEPTGAVEVAPICRRLGLAQWQRPRSWSVPRHAGEHPISSYAGVQPTSAALADMPSSCCSAPLGGH